MDMFKSMLRSSNQNQNEPNQPDESSWMISTLSKVVGTFAGLFGMLCGVFAMLSISPYCIFAGAVLLVEAFAVTLIEAPCFCIFLDFSQIPSNFFDAKPHYIRATVYLIFAVLPMTFCSGLSLFFGCGLLLITSGLYLMKALGRKASRQEMAANAITSMSTSPSAILVQNEQPMAGTHTASKLTGEIPSGVVY